MELGHRITDDILAKTLVAEFGVSDKDVVIKKFDVEGNFSLFLDCSINVAAWF